MAQCKQTPQEFIQNVFSPSVAVLCSADAEMVCQKNNLSFEELVQPFCRLTSEAVLKIPPNQSINVRNLRIVVKDLNTQLPQATVIKKMLNDSVSSCNSGNDASRVVTVKKGTYELQLPASLPWFESYRECFFDIVYPSDHEFIKHFLACLFVVSTSHPNPNAELVKLSQQQHQFQHQSPGKTSKWFSPNTLKGYILLHDIAQGEQYNAESAFQSMKSAFPGSFCHLLQINSQSLDENQSLRSMSGNPDAAQPPDPWSQFLTRKIDQYDQGSDYDSSPRTPQEDNIFPSKVMEGESEMDSNNHLTEEGTEVTEDSSLVIQDIDAIDHPLSPEDNPANTFRIIPDKTNLKIESVNERDTPLAGFVTNNKVVYPQETPSAPRPHGLCLTVSDLDRIRIFIHEFVVRGLLPHVERQIKILTEIMATSRKKFHRSILNVTKKWLVGNKPGYQGPNTPTNSVVYSPEATELQVRRLGDLAFMFQHYELAYQAFHTAKQDFNSDQAWLYYAGALEMAALSLFMLGTNSQRPYPFHYMDNAINTYLNICRAPHFATRCTMLSTECLKSKNLYSEAAMQFIKMTSEDSDLRSALLLEQAAYCFTAMPSTMIRKFAFHMVLAGYRFNKAGQRKHALRAYKQAYQTYKSRNWSLAEDHINFSIGRQSYNLKNLEQALPAFQNLLKENSLQPISQQTSFLKEYLFIYNLMNPMDNTELENLSFPLPIIDCQEIKVILGYTPNLPVKGNLSEAASVSFDDDESEDAVWFKLEELIVQHIQKGHSPLFKPSVQRLTGKTNNYDRPFAVVTEPITIEVPMKNPLSIPLALSNITLLWKFQLANAEGGDTQKLTNEINTGAKTNIAEEVIKTEVIASLILDSCQTSKVHLQLTPKEAGKLSIIGLSYNLAISDPSQAIGEGQTSNSATAQGKQYFKIHGPRLNNTKAEKTSQTYGPDFRLEPIVVPLMPLLQVNFHKFPTSMLCGEIKQITVEFVNKSQLPITKLYVCSSVPQYFAFGSDKSMLINGVSKPEKFISANTTDIFTHVESPGKIVQGDVPKVLRVAQVPIWLTMENSSHLPPGSSCKLPLWIRAPDQSGKQKLDLLFYYESEQEYSKMKNRILRHSASIDVNNSLSVEAIAIRSHGQTSDGSTSLAVAMEVENTNDVQDANIVEITLMQVSSASKFWSLRPMSITAHQEIRVNPRETAHICFKAIYTKHEETEHVTQSLFFSNIAFGDREIDSSATPCSDFCHRSRESFPDILSDEFIAQSQPSINYSHTPSEGDEECKAMESAMDVQLTLIVLWKAFIVNSEGVNTTVMGQHHLFIKNINALVSTTPEVKQAADKPFRIVPDPERPLLLPRPQPSSLVLTQLMQCTILHPDQVEHNFDETRTCSVYVTLVLYNCSHLSLQVVVDTSKTLDSFPLQKTPIGQQPSGYLATYQASVATNFAWVGPTLISLPSLSPKESRKIALRACFFAPGTYNMASVYVGVRRVSTPEEQLTQQRPCPPSLMLVKSVT